MRKRISASNKIKKYFILICLGMLPFISLNIYFENGFDIFTTFLLILMGFIFSSIYLYFDRVKILEYDKNYLFVKGKKNEVKIKLEQIKKIKKTNIEVNDKSIWRIYYTDNFYNEKSIRIRPRFNSEYFNEFRKSVKLKNENLIIE